MYEEINRADRREEIVNREVMEEQKKDKWGKEDEGR